MNAWDYAYRKPVIVPGTIATTRSVTTSITFDFVSKTINTTVNAASPTTFTTYSDLGNVSLASCDLSTYVYGFNNNPSQFALAVQRTTTTAILISASFWMEYQTADASIMATHPLWKNVSAASASAAISSYNPSDASPIGIPLATTGSNPPAGNIWRNTVYGGFPWYGGRISAVSATYTKARVVVQFVATGTGGNIRTLISVAPAGFASCGLIRV